MKREIIKIIEEKCNGCAQCVPNCPEGALQVIDGKARLVGELLCDGLGACIGNCPEGAIVIEEREAEGYDEIKVMENVVNGGGAVVAAHLKHLKEHGQHEYFKQAQEYLAKRGIKIPREIEAKPLPSGCPGTMMQDFRNKERASAVPVSRAVAPPSALRQWPIQLQLLNPHAPYFQNAELVIAADCVPFAFANFHARFLEGKALVILCPKLDRVMDLYQEKLAEIFRVNNVVSITVVHMEVPCCFGVGQLVQEALKLSGQNVIIKDYTISLEGEII